MVYNTKGTCASSIEIEVEDNIVKTVRFRRGCDGNAQGISRLVVGMSVDEVIERLEGIKCGRRNTSCPDQLAQALKEVIKERNN